jgi:hypothetical protein
MKKATLSLAIMLWLFSYTEGYSQQFQGGINAGLNAAQIDGDGDEGFGKLGLNAGAFVARPIIEDLLYWQFELRYTSRGKYKYPTPQDRSIEVANLHYLEAPLSLHYFYREKFQVELGLSPDVLLLEAYADEDGPISTDYANELDRFGLTAFAGIWYYPLGDLGIGVRYNYSVIPFYRFDAYAVRYRDSGFFHDVLSLNVKYYFLR